MIIRRFVRLALILNLAIMFFGCVSSKNNIENEKQVFAVYKGSFDSNYHTDGVMEFTLYNDGTLIGHWLTENHTFTLTITGDYIIKGSEVIMTASGMSSLWSEVDAKVIIFATGTLEANSGSGSFSIYIDYDIPNDDGKWTAQKI